MIDDIAIDIWSSQNFASIEDIIKAYNPTIRISNFTSNKKILMEFRGFLSKLICRETFSNRAWEKPFPIKRVYSTYDFCLKNNKCAIICVFKPYEWFYETF